MESNSCDICGSEDDYGVDYYCLECSKNVCHRCIDKQKVSNKRGYQDLCPECGERLEKNLG